MTQRRIRRRYQDGKRQIYKYTWRPNIELIERPRPGKGYYCFNCDRNINIFMSDKSDIVKLYFHGIDFKMVAARFARDHGKNNDELTVIIADLMYYKQASGLL